MVFVDTDEMEAQHVLLDPSTITDSFKAQCDHLCMGNSPFSYTFSGFYRITGMTISADTNTTEIDQVEISTSIDQLTWELYTIVNYSFVNQEVNQHA